MCEGLRMWERYGCGKTEIGGEIESEGKGRSTRGNLRFLRGPQTHKME